MYSIAYNNGTVISKFLIAAAPNFKLFYRMPVPDFFLAARPTMSEPELSVQTTTTTSTLEVNTSEFQSYSLVYEGCARNFNLFKFTGDGTNHAQQFTLPTPALGLDNELFQLSYDITVGRSTGTDDQAFFIIWDDGSTSYDFGSGSFSTDPSTHGPSTFIVFQDSTGTGKQIFSKQGSYCTIVADSFGNFDPSISTISKINICPIGNTPSSSDTYTFFIQTSITPFTNNVVSSSPVDDEEGLPAFPTMVGTSLFQTPLDVNVIQSATTDVVIINDDPIHVQVDNIDPIPVYIFGDITITDPIAVIGTTEQTLPIWTTQYGPPRS